MSQLVPTEQGYQTQLAKESQLVPTEQGYQTESLPSFFDFLSQLVPTEQGY